MVSSNVWQSAFTVLVGFRWFVYLGTEIAIIVTIATAVRRQRPDAWGPIFTWAIVSAVTSLGGSVIAMVLPSLTTHSGMEGFYKGQVISQAFGIPIHIIVVVLLARGLVLLARPPAFPPTPNEPPYR